METTRRSAFSLLELIVVVMIVSLVGFLVFSSAIKEQKKSEPLDPSTLPKTFRKLFQHQGEVELFCIDKCQKCYVAKGKEIVDYNGSIDFGKEVEVYQLNKDNHLVQIEEFGRINDKKISLRYHLYANGSSTQMIISNNQGVYYLPSYFGEAKKVTDIEEAKELWIKENYNLRDSGNYY